MASVTNALGQTTRLIAQPTGEVTEVLHPDGSREHYTYDALSLPLSHTDADDHTTRLVRNVRGQPLERRDAKGQRQRYAYDGAQRLARVTDDNEASYLFHYDASDRLAEEIRVDGLRRRFRYDPAGRLVRLDEYAPGRPSTDQFVSDTSSWATSAPLPSNMTPRIACWRASLARRGWTMATTPATGCCPSIAVPASRHDMRRYSSC